MSTLADAQYLYCKESNQNYNKIPSTVMAILKSIGKCVEKMEISKRCTHYEREFDITPKATTDRLAIQPSHSPPRHVCAQKN